MKHQWFGCFDYVYKEKFVILKQNHGVVIEFDKEHYFSPIKCMFIIYHQYDSLMENNFKVGVNIKQSILPDFYKVNSSMFHVGVHQSVDFT